MTTDSEKLENLLSDLEIMRVMRCNNSQNNQFGRLRKNLNREMAQDLQRLIETYQPTEK